MNEADTHQRRKHYSGKYPKHFEEKYKELDPERYAETAAHVKSKGITPAGTHVPICVREILELLQITPGMRGADATLGYGGHTEEILKKLEGRGCLYALDIDPLESAKTERRLRALGYGEEVLKIRHINFAEIDRITEEAGKLDFVLADLGVSSMQLDDPSRGFSFRENGPLDLRLNPDAGIPAADRLREMTVEEIEGMLRENADEPMAREIARSIVSAEKKQGIRTTFELREAVEKALWRVPAEEAEELRKKAVTRTFQALRIDVNSEFEALEQLMLKLPEVLQPGGRAAILTFHSGEDRIVKKMFRAGLEEGLYSEAPKEVIRPGAEEYFGNPRARSAKLRYAVRA